MHEFYRPMRLVKALVMGEVNMAKVRADQSELAVRDRQKRLVSNRFAIRAGTFAGGRGREFGRGRQSFGRLRCARTKAQYGVCCIHTASLLNVGYPTYQPGWTTLNVWKFSHSWPPRS